MTIPFFRDGFAMPVAQALLVLLNQEVAKTELNIERLTQLTFNFRNPGYSAEQGGVHPVEIRLIRGLDGWLFDYVTDFSYQGQGQDAELCKEARASSMGNTPCWAGDRCGWPKRGSCSISGKQLHCLPPVGMFQRHGRRGLGGHDEPRISALPLLTSMVGTSRRQRQDNPHPQWPAMAAA